MQGQSAAVHNVFAQQLTPAHVHRKTKAVCHFLVHTSKRRPHGEVVIIYFEEVLRLGLAGLGHVRRLLGQRTVEGGGGGRI